MGERPRIVARDERGSASIAWSATLLLKRDRALAPDHLRYRKRTPPERVLHCFALDCSGSMLGGEQLALAKGLLIALFDRAGLQRAEAALVCFGGTSAELRFGPAVPRWWNERWLRPVGGGGGTPLALGIARADQLLTQAARRDAVQRRWLWVLSDGRSTDTPQRPRHADRIVFVDFERAAVPLRRCERLAGEWDAECIRPEALIAHHGRDIRSPDQ
ncbi:vWA domain-containing protein [Paraburkholderia phosphatilytica]|uniref:vWA domain-containing protein n=1 Tax=Paraburkholderia phosphatilytica TaxID=2282883 RepID=UPI00197E5A62|nr:magnesium chelatase [Paraburkholderia phosphatilytica]